MPLTSAITDSAPEKTKSKSMSTTISTTASTAASTAASTTEEEQASRPDDRSSAPLEHDPLNAGQPGQPGKANHAASELTRLFGLVADDFAAVNDLIPRQLTSDVDLVESIGRYIVESGGKRLRPLIVLLGARASGVQGNNHIRLAAIIEFLHTATLLHDDVVDRSGMRRGRATANALWGNAPSVLVGDFLYSRAFQLMVELKDLNIMAILADATNVIAEGEVLQLANIGNADLSETSYREVIRCKTAMLFQAAAQASALLAGPDTERVQSLRDYGLHFGMAYQLVDDWLDYAGDAEVMGKNVGDDLAEGKATLPLIYTMAEGTPAAAKLVRDALQSKCSDQLGAVCAAVQNCGALDYTRNQARAASANALSALRGLRANKYREALEDLAYAAVARLS